MRRVSDETILLAREAHGLAKRHAWLARRRRIDDDIRARLMAVADSGEWWAIPDVISLALHGRPAVAEAACEAIASLSSRVPLRQLAAFDRLFRARFPFSGDDYYAWLRLEPSGLDALEALEHGRAALRMALCHPSGYVRSAAIRLCAKEPDGTELPYLLLRTADWVEPVRRFAIETVRGMLGRVPLRGLVDSLPLLDQMSGWRRGEGSPVLADIDATLATTEGTALLQDALGSSDRFIRRSVAKRLLAAGNVAADRVLKVALEDSDPGLRAWAGRQILDGDRATVSRFRNELLRNGSGWIRFRGALRLIEVGEPPPWQDLYLDLHGGVRELGQDLALEADVAPDDEYRQRLGTLRGTELAGALLGLSETGGPSDQAIVARFLHHVRPRVRRTALVALAKLDDPDIVETCLRAFDDEAPSVVHTACRLLRRHTQHVPAYRAWELLESAKTIVAAKDALSLLANAEYWPSLPYLLRALGFTEGELRERVEHSLMLWQAQLTCVFTSPSASVVADTRAALATDAAVRYRTEIERVLAHREAQSSVGERQS